MIFLLSPLYFLYSYRPVCILQVLIKDEGIIVEDTEAITNANSVNKYDHGLFTPKTILLKMKSSLRKTNKQNQLSSILYKSIKPMLWQNVADFIFLYQYSVINLQSHLIPKQIPSLICIIFIHSTVVTEYWICFQPHTLIGTKDTAFNKIDTSLSSICVLWNLCFPRKRWYNTQNELTH